jgi:hypothetical protein
MIQLTSYDWYKRCFPIRQPVQGCSGSTIQIIQRMRTPKSFIHQFAAVALLLAAASSASAVSIGDTGSFSWDRNVGTTAVNSGAGAYGGAFSLYNLAGLENTSYASAARYSNGAKSGFITFCLEVNEFAVSPSHFVVNSVAMNGGVGGGVNGDPISVGTAWLYSQFASGQLAGIAGFSYTGAANYGMLQEAFWLLEQEVANSVIAGGNALYNYVLANIANATSDAAVGQFGVYVLNNYSNAARTNRAQDFLYYNVPDGGATLMLMGLSVGGVALFRRYFVKQTA